ncbi:MAG: 4'-phosphopantetheinyl transferase [Pseudorhodobacter sp.]
MPDGTLAGLVQAARKIIPIHCGLGAADPQAPPSGLWPGEVIQAVPARLAEFAAGRIAARAAMAELGHPPTAIPMGSDRAPIWPTGLSGSISHSKTACLAAVTPLPYLIGIDLEPDEDLSPELWPTILRPSEIANLPRHHAARHAKQIFSAKEAAYKAQYASSRQFIDFQALEVSIQGRRFTATFCQSVPGFTIGAVLEGQISVGHGHILTAVICDLRK